MTKFIAVKRVDYKDVTGVTYQRFVVVMPWWFKGWVPAWWFTLNTLLAVVDVLSIAKAAVYDMPIYGAFSYISLCISICFAAYFEDIREDDQVYRLLEKRIKKETPGH